MMDRKSFWVGVWGSFVNLERRKSKENVLSNLLFSFSFLFGGGGWLDRLNKYFKELQRIVLH